MGTSDMQDDPIGGQPPDDTPLPGLLTWLPPRRLYVMWRDMCPHDAFLLPSGPLDGSRTGTGQGSPDDDSVLPTSETLIRGAHQAIDRLVDILRRREQALRYREEAVTDRELDVRIREGELGKIPADLRDEVLGLDFLREVLDAREAMHEAMTTNNLSWRKYVVTKFWGLSFCEKC